MEPISAMVFAVSVILGSTYFASKFLPNYRPGKNKIKKDLAEMRSIINAKVKDLVPWNRKEMELVSYRMENITSKGGITKSASGLIESIYHEPMAIWASKAYANAARNNLILIRTSKYEFSFHSTPKGISIGVGEHFLGNLSLKGTLTSPDGKKVLAQIHYQPTEEYYPIDIYGKEVGALINPSRASDVNPRVIGLMAKLNEDAEAIYTALMFTEILRAEVEK